MKKKRSVGVTIFGIFAIMFSFAYLTEIQRLSKVIDLKIVVIMGISFLVFGIFILKLKNWARILFLFVIGGQSLIYVSWGFAHGANKGFLEYFVMLIVAVFLFLVSLYYFTRPKVKEQFKR